MFDGAGWSRLTGRILHKVPFRVLRSVNKAIYAHSKGQDSDHYENTLIQIYWKFYNEKRKIFRLKKNLIFFIVLLKT